MNRSSVRIPLVVALAAAFGCSEKSISDPEVQPEERLTPSDVVGTYDLVSAEGLPLPANWGRVTYFSGQYVLQENGQFSFGMSTELCLLGTCQPGSASLTGTWLLTWDNKVYLDAPNGGGSMLAADGETIVQCPTGSNCFPRLEYRKR